MNKTLKLVLTLTLAHGLNVNVNSASQDAFGAIQIIPLTGVFAEIGRNIENSSASLKILQGKQAGNKQQIAALVEGNLGAHIPPTILWLGNYYVTQNNLQKAALYHKFALFRTYIDVEASQDLSLGDVVSLVGMQRHLNEVTEQDQDTYYRLYAAVDKDVVALDRRTPRTYEKRWASLHSIIAYFGGGAESLNYVSDEKYQQIVESQYARVR